MDSEFRRQFLSPKVIVLAVFVGLETEDTCVEDKTLVVPKGATPLATPVSSPDRGFERETLGPAESVTESPQDERVLSGHGDSAGNDVVGLVQLRWVGVPFQAFTPFCRNMLGIIWFTTTQAFCSSAVQEHEFLCPVSRIYLGTGHSRRLLRIPPKLGELASKVMTEEMVAAQERQRLREKRSAPPAGGKKS